MTVHAVAEAHETACSVGGIMVLPTTLGRGGVVALQVPPEKVSMTGSGNSGSGPMYCPMAAQVPSEPHDTDWSSTPCRVRDASAGSGAWDAIHVPSIKVSIKPW